MAAEMNADPKRSDELIDLDAALAACLDAAREACAILVRGRAELTGDMVRTKSERIAYKYPLHRYQGHSSQTLHQNTEYVLALYHAAIEHGQSRCH